MSKSRWIIEQLESGNTITTRLHGNSMKPKIHSGNQVTIEPVKDLSTIQVNDIVYCKVAGNIFAHLVSAIGDRGFQISNNHGHINGWTHKIYGKVIKVEK